MKLGLHEEGIGMRFCQGEDVRVVSRSAERIDAIAQTTKLAKMLLRDSGRTNDRMNHLMELLHAVDVKEGRKNSEEIRFCFHVTLTTRLGRSKQCANSGAGQCSRTAHTHLQATSQHSPEARLALNELADRSSRKQAGIAGGGFILSEE